VGKELRGTKKEMTIRKKKKKIVKARKNYLPYVGDNFVYFEDVDGRGEVCKGSM
jgi:hypothetical protein